MDSTDQKLLALLRQDARTTVATLATKLGVSRGTVTNRVKKLEDEGAEKDNDESGPQKVSGLSLLLSLWFIVSR